MIVSKVWHCGWGWKWCIKDDGKVVAKGWEGDRWYASYQMNIALNRLKQTKRRYILLNIAEHKSGHNSPLLFPSPNCIP